MNSMTNLAIPNHVHNGWDANQLDPAIALLGFPIVQATLGVLTTNTLVGGTTYTTAQAVKTTGGTGVGLTVNTTAVAGVVTAIVINNAGSGYTVGDVITITGGDGLATFHVLTIQDATTTPLDKPQVGTFRFYVDTTPQYVLWAYLSYTTNMGALTPSWQKITFGTVAPVTTQSAVFWRVGSTFAASTTGYVSNSLASTTESAVQIPIPSNGTISNFYVVTSTAQDASGTLVFTFRRGGIDQGITATVAAGAAAGTVSDLTHSITVTAGQLIDVKVVNNATAVSASISQIIFRLT